MRSMGAMLLAMLLAGPADAEQAQAWFQVSAQVPPRAVLTNIEWPVELELTAQDVALGYKDVAARVQVRHNDPRGYLLRLTPRVGLARRVEVQGFAAPVVLEDAEVEIRPLSTQRQQDFTLAFRFVLEATARPGAYPLPVHLAATPL